MTKRKPSKRRMTARRGSGSWVIAVAVLASAMAFIDATALGVALPAIQSSLGASGPQVLWIQNGYVLPLTALLLAGGALGDQHGRKRVFAWGVILFALASAYGGAASNPAQLISARVLQGCGAALMLPGALGLMISLIPSRHHGRAIAQWSAWGALATLAGPVLGGLLTQFGWWRAVFWINLPLAVTVLVLLVRRVPAERRGVETSLWDWRETLPWAGGLGLTSWALIEAPRLGMERGLVPGALTLGLGWMAWRGVHLWQARQRPRRAAEAAPISLRRLGPAAAVTILVYAPLYALQLFLPLNLIQVQGYRADMAGLAQVPLIGGLIALSPLVGRFVDRHGPWRPLWVGTALCALGFLSLMLPGGATGGAAYWVTWFPSLLLVGAGLAFCVTPLSAAIMSGVTAARVGLAAGFNSLLSRLAALLAFGVVAPLLMMVFVQALTWEIGPLNITEGEFEIIRDEAVHWGNTQPPATLGVDQAAGVVKAVKRAFLTSFRGMCLAGALMAGAGFMLVARRGWPSPRS